MTPDEAYNFYNMCQRYRHASVTDQEAVLIAYNEICQFVDNFIKERDEYALLLFQPCGESHHDANKCPYCKENLNGK